MNLECSGYGSGSGAALRAARADSSAQSMTGRLATTEAGTKRRRTYRSCKACRDCKTRCSGERPVCIRCAEKSLDCIYSSGPSPGWVHALSPQSSSGREPERQDGQLPAPERATVTQDSPTVLTPQPDGPSCSHHAENTPTQREADRSRQRLSERLPDGVPPSLSWYGTILESNLHLRLPVVFYHLLTLNR
jgi:hypothetical protein